MATSEFAWLAGLHKLQCYTTGDGNSPAKSIDFGDNGHTASPTDWHELLQLTAPDPLCGVVFVRDDFPDTADAILARAQQPDQSGKKGTFGLEMDSMGSDFVLGERRNQGFVNFRWPYIQYELKRKYSDGGVEQIHVGTYEAICFVKDDVVYQVICVRAGRLQKPTTQNEPESQSPLKVRFRLGGNIHFGCSCSTFPPKDIEEVDSQVDEICLVESKDDGKRLVCCSPYYQKRLEMQLFVDDEPRTIRLFGPQGKPEGTGRGEANISGTHDVELEAGNSTFIVATYALKAITRNLYWEGTRSILLWNIGIPSNSDKMSDRLWTACLTTNYDATEAMDFCAIGTAVEQTLCVSSVPMMQSKVPRQLSSALTPESNTENIGIALVNNIMVGQYVDLESAFWQIRLLVKVNGFLRSRRFEADLLDTTRPLNDVRALYLTKLQSHIRRTLIWLLELNVEPDEIVLAVGPRKDAENEVNRDISDRARRCSSLRSFMKADKSYNRSCFVTLAVWFAIKHCPEAITGDFKVGFILPALKKISSSPRNSGESLWNDSSPKNNVLQWFHLTCLLLICGESLATNPQNQDIDGFAASGLNRQKINASQERCEKSITRLRKGKTGSYSTEDEETDRLFLVAEELGFEILHSPTTSSLAVARAKQIRTKIIDRKPTTRFYPGPRPSKSGDTLRVASNGPWELSCLNHHTLLRTMIDRSSELDVQACRDACFEFLLSDYSFMSSWDRASKAMVEKWWDFEIGSIICATLLDLKSAGILKSAGPEKRAADTNESKMDSSMAPIEAEGHTSQTVIPRGNLPRADSLRDLLQLLKQELIQNESGSAASNRPFEWLSWKPPKYYHPICWAKLTNGVTKASNLKTMKKVPPQLEIIKYLSGSDENKLTNSLEVHMEEAGQLLEEDLDYISIFDLVANYDFAFRSREHQSMTSNDVLDPPPNVRVQQPPSAVRRRVEPLQENTLRLLNRTLVDCGTKFRILFAERCSPSILKAFICGWHPDALDSFDNYLSTSSRFSDSREAMWTTTITISHWSIWHTDSSKEYPQRFHEGRTRGDFPPANIANPKLINEKLKRVGSENERPVIRVIEERSTSLVMTGDSQGFFWLCTIWSSLTRYKHLVVAVNSLPTVLQSFIHQQASGRRLAFLILLGHLCERLASEHEEMLIQLNTVVDLGQKTLLEGIALDASDAVERLERMLWGLEALRVFDDRLSTSLSQIRKVRETLEHTIDQEAAQQDIELIQEYKNVLGEFGKRYNVLLDVQIKIQLRIRQVAGLRDGISTVTNVRDSRTTIKQGNNIRVLTLITIAYLPLGFVASLFSNNQNLLPEGTGTTLYVILSVVLSIATYIVALTLGTILNIVQPRWDKLKEKAIPGSAEGSEIRETDNVMMMQPSSKPSHTRSRSKQPGSQQGHILPLTKEHESSDTNV